nr:MAG TPA: HEPARIN AND INTEGRIN BINDING SEGMENT AND INTEGRIN BINDING.8A [Caudoviricetes sp.]
MSQALSNLAVGSKVKFGKYQVNTEKAQPIIWTIVAKNHVSTPAYPSNSVTLHAAEILDLRCFDAKEPSNSNSGRQKYGNNRYSVSNLDQWLNKDAAGGAWYSAAHSADHSPDTAVGTGGYGTQYATRPGFLNGFTDDEKAAILSTTIRVVKPSVDGGSYEDVVRKIFLPSTTEVGLANENSIAEGAAWGYYTSNTARIGYVTQQCFSNTPSSSKPSSKTTAWYWWLRTPDYSYAYYARYAYSDGSLSSGSAYIGDYGVRPALNLSSSLLVSDTTDSDGCYTVMFASALTPPATLTIPKLVKGRGALIKWSAVDGADSYILQRKTSAGGSYSQRYSGTNTYFDDQIQTRYTVYGYRVCAVSGETQSDWNTSDDITAISAPNPPGYPEIPDTINVGDTYTVTWTAPSVSEVEGYELQRKVDDGDYTTVYKGANLSYTDTAQPTWTKVQYRVAAYIDGDVYSATWSGSDIRTIVGGTSTVPSMPETITVPALTAGQSATITWTGVANAAGYALQRSVDGASYMTVYRGENTSYIDTVGSAWLTVQYRVCAYDSNNNSSDYKTSDVFSVVQPVTSLLEAIRAHTEQDIKITFADNTVLGKADVAITGDGVKITDILNGDTDYTFGKAVCKQVEMTLFNVDNKFNNFDFTQEFTLQIGVKVGAAFQYVTVGVFKGERPDKVRGKLIDFTAYDRMQKFEVSASDFIENMTFPVTLGAVFSSLCAAVGVEPITTTFTNSTKNFTFNPFSTSDYTAREVLAWIAEAAGCYARVNADGKVELNTFTTNSYKILKTDRFEMSESEFETPVIGKLECYTSYGDQLVTAGTGTNTYVISDNPFLYIENDTEISVLQPYVNAIFAKASLFPAYSPIAVRAEWYPEIKCGDIITVVNDYDEVKTLPIFSQTIKWNGFGKVEYESTGGLVREIEPVQQRELEAIKKSMLRGTDLSTAVESYLNTQEGKASITSAVKGKFVEVSSGSTITTTTAIEQLIQKTEKGIESKISLSASYGSGTIGSNVRALLTLFANADSSSIRLSANALDLTATETTGSTSTEEVGTYNQHPNIDGIPAVPDNEYDFTKTSDGYYTSQNAGVHSSYSYGGFKFNFTRSTTITIRCISYGEAEHDYGIVSNLDTSLDWDNNADTTGVKKAFSGENESSSSYVDLTMTVPSGNHYITFKYIKDSSVHKNGDYFKIKCFVQKTSRGKATISLKSGNVQISSADINFNGLVTFTDLSTSGATTIDGGNVTTDNLYVNKVFFAENENYTIVTSKMSAQNGVVQVGVQSPISGMAAFLELYGSFIYFIDPDNSSARYQLQVQTANRKIIPGGNGYWDIGGVQNYFKTLYVEKIIFGDNSSQTTAP